jgi:hypothetical protein
MPPFTGSATSARRSACSCQSRSSPSIPGTNTTGVLAGSPIDPSTICRPLEARRDLSQYPRNGFPREGIIMVWAQPRPREPRRFIRTQRVSSWYLGKVSSLTTTGVLEGGRVGMPRSAVRFESRRGDRENRRSSRQMRGCRDAGYGGRRKLAGEAIHSASWEMLQNETSLWP